MQGACIQYAERSKNMTDVGYKCSAHGTHDLQLQQIYKCTIHFRTSSLPRACPTTQGSSLTQCNVENKFIMNCACTWEDRDGPKDIWEANCSRRTCTKQERVPSSLHPHTTQGPGVEKNTSQSQGMFLAFL